MKVFGGVILFLCSLNAMGQEIPIEEFSVHVAHNDIIVTTRLSPNIPVEVLERLRSGLPVTFTYHYWLKSPRKHWKDKVWAKRDIHIRVKHDPVKMEYRVTYSEGDRLLYSKTLYTWQQAVETLITINDWIIFSVDETMMNKPLYVSCQVYILTRTKWLFFPDDVESEVAYSPLFTIHE